MGKTQDKGFLDDPVVDRLSDELLEAMRASAAARGLGGLKSLAIVAQASDGAGGGVSGVLTWGCDCSACKVEMITALAEAQGATATLTISRADGTPLRPKVH